MKDKLPGVIVAGPMYAVKELTQTLYAQYIANVGYIIMVFDYSYIGSSEGQPRGLEDPDMKESDIRSTIRYMCTIEDVDADRIGGVGICGSGAYMAYGAMTDGQMPIISSWYWNMVHGTTPEQVKQDLEGLQIMRVLGKNMAWFLKVKEAAERAGVPYPEKEEYLFTNFID